MPAYDALWLNTRRMSGHSKRIVAALRGKIIRPARLAVETVTAREVERASKRNVLEANETLHDIVLELISPFIRII